METIICPRCDSRLVKRNGHTHNGKQNHQCKACQRQFVEHPANISISAEQKTLISKLLLERISLRGICRVVNVSLPWLLAYLEDLYEEVPADLGIESDSERPEAELQVVEIETDEMWSFVGEKANKVWLWLASERNSKRVLAFYLGDRSTVSACALWEKLPACYQQRGLFYTDDWPAYQGVIPVHQHHPSKKKPRLII